ncbi:DUF86 domain-containing protein [bacterium]|nr:DUF86 domain-containing protein [FCB group bacterium]MBL7191513.1 DUF86 domain-containing protein [bacterium]
MKRDIKLYLKDMLDNIDRIETFISNMSYDEFVEDEKTHLAVIRCIEIIGEACKKIPENIRNRYSQIPWKVIAGTRDKLIHAYFKIDLEMVWKVIKIDIPSITSALLDAYKSML